MQLGRQSDHLNQIIVYSGGRWYGRPDHQLVWKPPLNLLKLLSSQQSRTASSSAVCITRRWAACQPPPVLSQSSSRDSCFGVLERMHYAMRLGCKALLVDGKNEFSTVCYSRLETRCWPYGPNSLPINKYPGKQSTFKHQDNGSRVQ